MLPEDAGGAGHSLEALCLVLDNICREDSSLGGIIFTNALAQEILLAADAKPLLSEITDGTETPSTFLIGFQTMCNPSETHELPAASENGDGHTLSGTADYVVLGNIAGHVLLPAKINNSRAYSFFLVDTAAAGVTMSEPVVSHGLHACPAVDMTLKSVPARLVGAADEGEACFNKAAIIMQLAAAAMSCGIMKGAVKEAFAYCSERV